MKIFRADESEPKTRAGYTATYVADIELKQRVETAAFIVVHVDAEQRTEPHAHHSLQEVFIFLDDTEVGINEEVIPVGLGDVVIVDPGEEHWFSAPADTDVSFIAVKLPNIPDDKVKPSVA